MKGLRIVALTTIAFAGMHLAAGAQSISLTSAGTPYTQNFDAPASGLPTDSIPTATTVTWNSSTASLQAFASLPGWYVYEQDVPANTVRAGDGASNTGALYSFGVDDANDRALGSICSGSTDDQAFVAIFQNNTGAPLGSFDISYRGEQWRNGGAAADVLTFSWETAASLPTSVSNTNLANLVAGLNFVPTVNGGTATQLDGNATFQNLSATITLGAPLGTGEYLVIKWRDTDVTGGDHGMGIDNFSITPIAAPSNFAPTLSAAVVTPDQASPATPLSFSVNAQDTDGIVTAVNLRYKIAAAANATAGGYATAAMTLSSGTPANGTWTVSPAALSAVPTGNNVFFYFEATDDDAAPTSLGDETTAAFRKYSNGLRPTGTDIVINEVSFKGGAPGPTPDVDWVEFYNRSAGAIDLSYYGLSDNGTLGTGGRPFVLPFGATIPAGGFMVLTGNATTFSGYAPWASSVASTSATLIGDVPFGFGDVDDFRLYDDASTRALYATLSYDRDNAPWSGANATGRAAELIDSTLPTLYVGSNFSASAYKNVTGTPGAPNWAVPSAPATTDAGNDVTIAVNGSTLGTVLGTADDNQTEAALLLVTDDAPAGITTAYTFAGGTPTTPATVTVDVAAGPAVVPNTYPVVATFTDAAGSSATIAYTITVTGTTSVAEWQLHE